MDAVKAGVAELVDALDLGSSDESCGGSSPSARTKRSPKAFVSGEITGEPDVGVGFAEHGARRLLRAGHIVSQCFGRSGRSESGRIDTMQVTETLSQGLKHEFQISVPASD